MGGRKVFCLLLVCAVLSSCLAANAKAADSEGQESVFFITRASGSFKVDIPEKSFFTADTSFSLEAGETVTIKASYTPFTASVDVGLIDSDEVFHFITVTNGSVDQTIEIEERGNYTFAIRNNSSRAVCVSGYINY